MTERKVSSATVLEEDIAPAAEDKPDTLPESSQHNSEPGEVDSEAEEAAEEERKAEDEFVMGDPEAAEKRRERNRKKREKKREQERELKKRKFDDEAVMDEEFQEQGYGYSEWVPPVGAKHYSL